MKYTVRYNVFETNSSSVHSLTFGKKMEHPDLETDKDGYTVARYGWFDKTVDDYYEQSQKLSYLVSYLYYMFDNIEDLYDSDEFRILEEVIVDYCGTKGLKIGSNPNEPYLDHQSLPGMYNYVINDDTFFNKNFLTTFIFCPYVGIHTDAD